jgi:hypothetical protein
MKKYTHAWLAFMAMKRLDQATLPETEGSGKSEVQVAKFARSLVRWFKNYRDFVVQGAWYPDDVFADQGSSHGVKYEPDLLSEDARAFKVLPDTMEVRNLMMEESKLYGRPFNIVKGNLCDRCDAMAHTIVDNFKIQYREEKGNPIAPSSTHMAMRFFIMSHYIADAHMPLHCDARSLGTIHTAVENQWESAVKKSYMIDEDNERFFYDPNGYPLKTDKMKSLMSLVEEKILSRPFIYNWGYSDYSTWDYMSAITEYSYLLAYEMFPSDFEDTGWTNYKKTPAAARFEEYSLKLMTDAIDSIARAWLHVWIRYRLWGPDKQKST